MSPKTLYAEILSQAINRNPSASSSEVLEGIFQIMSKEILPTVFKNVGLPKFPSWSMLAFEKRGRKRRKIEPQEKLAERRIVIQQIERLKRQISWDGGNSARYDLHFPDVDTLTFLPAQDLSSNKKALTRILDYGEEIKTQSLEEPDKPYPKSLLLSEPKQPIDLSDEVQKKIISEPAVEEVFKRIEVGIRSLFVERKLDATVQVSFHSDSEIPSWKKYVITLNPPSSMDFEAKMNIRTLLDIAIRKEMDGLLKNASEDMKEYLYQLNKSIFIHIEL